MLSIKFASRLLHIRTLLFVCFVVLCGNANAQQKADTADKITIIIANTREIVHMRTDSGEYTKFIYDVVLYQGTDTLYCDSLYQNSTTQNFEAFSNVRIAQLGGLVVPPHHLEVVPEF